MWQHGTSRRLAHVIIEIRQDLIDAPQSRADWIRRLERILRAILADGGLRARLNRIDEPATV